MAERFESVDRVWELTTTRSYEYVVTGDGQIRE